MSQRSLARAIVIPATSTGGGGGAPTDATYITQTANGTLSAEQALASLATGMLKNTTGTGVLSIGTEGSDYYKPGGTKVAIADGGTGQGTAAAGFDALAPTTTRGDVIYRNATGNTRLAAGTSGQVLQTAGSTADPVWVAKPYSLMTAEAGASTGDSPAASTTRYFGANFFANPAATEANTGSFLLPEACTLRAIGVVVLVLGTLASAGSIAFDVRISDTTTVTGTTVAATAKQNTAFATGLSQACVAGDWWKIRLTFPAWVTAPTTVFYMATVYFDKP